MNHYIVYIVECHDSSYYTGVTNNLERRLWEHNTGFNKNCFTYKRRPVELKYFESCSDIKQAIAYEKQLKGWSRKKKQALFKEDYTELRRLSKSTVAKSLLTNSINNSSSNKQPFAGLRVTNLHNDSGCHAELGEAWMNKE